MMEINCVVWAAKCDPWEMYAPTYKERNFSTSTKSNYVMRVLSFEIDAHFPSHHLTSPYW